MRHVILTVVLGLSLTVSAVADERTGVPVKDFKLLSGGTRGGGEVVVKSGDKGDMLVLATQKTSDMCYMTAFANLNRKVAAQKKICFWLKGNINNKKSFLTVNLATSTGKKWTSHNSPHLNINDQSWRLVVLGLDADFQLSDATHFVRQMKFVLNLNLVAGGTKAVVEIAGVKIVSADEISALSTGATNEFLVKPGNKQTRPNRFNLPPVKLYFDFDNDDLATSIVSRTSHAGKNAIMDNRQTLGYRQLLTEQLAGSLACSEHLKTSDVVVYARAKKGCNAAAIIDAAANGRRVLIYGAVQDPALQALAPLKLEPIAMTSLPARSPLNIVDKVHPVFRNAALSDVTLGLYYKSQLNKGKVLATFADGTPAIAETPSGKGKIIHCAFAPGRNLIQSWFYDELFLRMVYYLAGHRKTASQLCRLSQTMQLCRRIDQAAVVAGILGKPATVISSLNKLKQNALAAYQNRDWDNLEKQYRESNEVMAAACQRDGLQYQLGMSEENFGRFGWLVGEGLLCANVNNKLVVRNGFHEYYVGNRVRPVVTLPEWRFQLNKENAEPQEVLYSHRWKLIGSATYQCQAVVPASWQGKTVNFEVAKGIDDTDVVYFNGKQIGATGVDTAQYWKASRNYRIPAELIKWGKPNQIRIVATNIRGGAALNSCPQLTLKQKAVSQSLSVSSIDWTHKSFDITSGSHKRQMTLSLLLPFALYDLPAPEMMISFNNSPQFAAWQSTQGVVISDLTSNDTRLYDLEKDGPFAANWLLLWQKENTKPQLLVFEKQPQIIEMVKSGTQINGLKIERQNSVGKLVVGWPFGSQEYNSTAWQQAIPAKVELQIKRCAAMVTKFPIHCREAFAIDTEKKRVNIVNRFEYININDDWQTETDDYAIVPPLVGEAVDQGILAATSENITNLNMPTKYGYLKAVNGKDRLTYQLDLPEYANFNYMDISGYKKLKAPMNEIFAGGVKWSCGGRMPAAAWTPAEPARMSPDSPSINKNIDLFAWCFGLVPANTGRLFLSDANRQQLLMRTVQRYQLPIENFQYKAFVRFREEPFSGIRYPVLFNSIYRNKTNYAPGFGSKVIYGDLNEACTVLTWLGVLFAENYGQNDFIKANWPFLKYGMKMSMVYDDWAYNSSGCREYGAGAWIDMLNCEYAGMMNYAKLAALSGDRQEQHNGLYRAAKRMLPTVMRLYFDDYRRQNSSDIVNRGGRIETISTVVGFNENDGARCYPVRPTSFNFKSAMDIFDMSQGFSADLALLYKKYAFEQVKTYLNKYALPALTDANGDYSLRLAYLPPFAFWGTPEATLQDMVADIVNTRKTRLMSDWPGMITGSKIGSVIFRAQPDLFIAQHSPMMLHQALYEVEKRTVTIELTANAKSPFIHLFSRFNPLSLKVNGVEQQPNYQPESGLITIPLEQGKSAISLKLGAENKAEPLFLKGI